MALRKQSLSPKSVYEQMFGTRHRGPGRPRAMEDGSVLFPAVNVPALLVRVAQRRAFAVVNEEQRDRLHSLYLAELDVLKRRGVEQVAADSGVVLEDASSKVTEEAA